MARKTASTKTVETPRRTEDKRKNIPTAEHRSVLQKEQEAPRTVKYPRNTDLDPQFVWLGKDEQDWSEPRQGPVYPLRSALRHLKYF